MVRRSTQTVLAALGLGAFLLCLAPTFGVTDEDDKQEKERAVSLDQVPAKVKATILKAAGKNQVKEVEEISLRLYEAEWVQNGKETEVLVTAGGKVLAKEMEEAGEKQEGKREVAEKQGKKREAEEDDDDDDEKEAGEKQEGKREVAEKQGKKHEAEEDEDDDDEEAEHAKKVSIDQIPAAAKAAILKLAGKNKIKEIEEVQKKFYEADWMQGKNEVDILVSADGKLISREVENAKDGGRGDEDDDKDEDKDE
jgi:hypothetical protein